jgi:hypothetical protein
MYWRALPYEQFLKCLPGTKGNHPCPPPPPCSPPPAPPSPPACNRDLTLQGAQRPTGADGDVEVATNACWRQRCGTGTVETLTF